MRPPIQRFTTDRWEGYLNAIEEYIAAHDDVNARLGVDRFHVAQQDRDDFDAIALRWLCVIIVVALNGPQLARRTTPPGETVQAQPAAPLA